MTTSRGSALLQPDDGSVAPGSARSLLFTILGELVWPTGEPVWTATLVHVLRGLGVEEQTARQAIARAAASDWITAARLGREVSWSLTPKLRQIFESGSLRVYSLSDSFSQWDGRWLVVLFEDADRCTEAAANALATRILQDSPEKKDAFVVRLDLATT